VPNSKILKKEGFIQYILRLVPTELTKFSNQIKGIKLAGKTTVSFYRSWIRQIFRTFQR